MSDAVAKQAELIPRLRGVIHTHALWVAFIAGLALVAGADGARARLGAAVYATGLCMLFLGSALYHRWPGDPRWLPLLRRIDHSTIFVFIAASYTPLGLLTLSGTFADAVLITAWAGALAGVGFSVAWISAPRVLVAITYIALGWVAVATFPQVLDRAGWVPTALILLGGLLYSAGAAVYAARRPDPLPAVFGFHEVFHTLVTAAVLVHFIAIAGWIVPVRW
ncbi:MAG TPA: hemolysin III family protein [Thermoleophilaceae bacterium]|nr:hemolysin III family protein [Thermoleophilaceae bacterium]